MLEALAITLASVSLVVLLVVAYLLHRVYAVVKKEPKQK